MARVSAASQRLDPRISGFAISLRHILFLPTVSNSQFSDRSLRDVVADAGRRRRWRDAARLGSRWAPLAGSFFVGAALLARAAGWPRLIVPAAICVGVIAAVLLAGQAWRLMPPTDAMAAAADRDAALGGELRSAHWFSSQPRSDGWVAYHVDQALAAARQIDWQSIYRPPRAGRRWVATAVLMALSLAVSVTQPVRTAPQGLQAAVAQLRARALADPTLSAEAREQLSALFASLEQAPLSEAQLARANSLVDTLAHDPSLQKQLQDLLQTASQPPADAKQPKAAQAPRRTEPAARDRSDPPESSEAAEKWAREEVAAREAGDGAQEKSEAAAEESRHMVMMPGSAQSGTGSPQAMQAREAASSTSVSQLMVGDQLGESDSPAGVSIAGRSRSGGAPSDPIELGVLNREVIAAHDDIKGADVKNVEHRRRAEQAASELVSSRAAALDTFDRARAEPPPPVPAGRRLLLEGYFKRTE
ncbi:MAG: hypothetical protein ABI051_18280 [Vicinamibacterales bacterium]